MQNKPNFQDAQMNVSILSQMDYENKCNWTLGENKPKQTQTDPISNAKKCPCSSAKPIRGPRNFQETFNIHLFLFDNSIVLHNMYIRAYLPFEYGEGL
jgi:hypothetical protein